MSALPKSWHNHEGYRDVFNAALSGICANPEFFGAIYQGSAAAAVEFALEVLRKALDEVEPPTNTEHRV